ncbi:MAG TPA: hypothetical protein VMU84_14285 [Thermoanaerobaculia bacterium]|nr:hypothetical protein [Thermoanaerobaculia bacterium]
MLIVLIATSAHAITSARDLFVPIAGRAIAADRRGFFTTLWITNESPRAADVTIAFLASGQPNPSPRTFALQLAGNETRVIDDVGEEILGVPRATGALRVTSNRELVVQARVYGLHVGEPLSRSTGTLWEAIPASIAIGNGETTSLQGVDDKFRYKLYAIETTGHPLTVAIALIDRHGSKLAQKQLYLGVHEHRAWDIAQEFANVRGGALVRIRGVNGSGRIIAGGAQITTESQDAAAFEMLPAREARHRFATAEIVAWGAVAFAIGTAALRGRG